MNAPLPTFDDPEIARAVERLSPEDLHALRFGVVRVDEEGTTRLFNAAEAKLSGYGDRPALGRGFFTEVAPCMNNPSFLGRIERARAAGQLDIEFDYVGDFDDRDKELRVRVQSAAGGGYWIFIDRD